MTQSEALQKLSGIREQAERIIKLFENDHVQSQTVPKAQELFRSLKENLHAEYKRMSTVRGEAALSHLESSFYKPAIEDAWANTQISGIRWNSRPNGRWLDELSSVSDYMGYWSSNLKEAVLK